MNTWTQSIRRASNRSNALRGNALMEYVVPAAVILISAGVLVTVIDADKLMGEYFMSASGHTTSSMSGTTLQTKGLAENSYGDIENGLGGFKRSFVLVLDGSGADTGEESGGPFYLDPANRTGGRQAPPSTEQLFP
jgi:hypothetical protein